MFKRLKKRFSKSPAEALTGMLDIRGGRLLQGRYDAAQNTAEYARYWQHADGLSAAAAMTPDVRRTLRNRARYEVANNSYAFGIVETLADYRVR